MAGHACFDHLCSGEADLVARIKATAYLNGATSWTVGENIAWGEQALGTPANIVAAWMHSPGHRANILNADFDDIGIGFVSGAPFSAHEANAGIYTTDFGSRHG
jgi:uncharacterized protein YkwD